MSRARILVVDDEPAMLRTVSRILGDHHDVACVPTSVEAIEALRAFKPDLAIIDIRMPEMDGFELMARLKAQRPDLDVIVMTGSVAEADAKLIRSIREKAFYFIPKPFDREVLQTLVARCLELRRLTEANRRHVARLEGELDAARAFQRSLLPPEENRLEGIALCARYRPCAEMGGDFFDYASAGRGRVGVLVADVSGHGASAAMLTGIVKAAFHSSRESAYEPGSVIARIAEGIRPLADNLLVTALCARISSEGASVEYVNAGHPPGLVWSSVPAQATGHAADPRLLESTGPLLSPAWPKARWEQKTVAMNERDRLLLYTDGLLEAQGPEGEFGLRNILAQIRTQPAGGPGLVDALLGALQQFLAGRPAEDDLTLLTAHTGA